MLYSEYGARYFRLWGIIFTFIIVLGTIYFILKKVSKNIVIPFDDNQMVINGKNYKKEEIKGIYSYDYLADRKSIISIQIQFINNKNLEITDTEYKNQYDTIKAEKLRQFLKTMMKELGFVKQKKK